MLSQLISYFSFSARLVGEKKLKKCKAWDKDRETVYQHRLDLGKINLVSYQLKTKLLSFPAHLHSMLNFTIPLPPPPAWVAVQDHEEQELWLVPNTLPLLLPSSLTFPCQHVVLHMGYSPLRTAPMLVLSVRCSPSEGDCSRMAYPWAAVPTLWSCLGSPQAHRNHTTVGVGRAPSPTPSQSPSEQSDQAHTQVGFEDVQWGDPAVFPGNQCQGSVILTASFRPHPPAPPWAPPQALGSSARYPLAAGREPALLWSSTEQRGCRELLLQCLKHLLPLLFQWP